MPYEYSLHINLLCETISKALAKLMYTMTVYNPNQYLMLMHSNRLVQTERHLPYEKRAEHQIIYYC